jgi:hypothetical protein
MEMTKDMKALMGVKSAQFWKVFQFVRIFKISHVVILFCGHFFLSTYFCSKIRYFRKVVVLHHFSP